MEDRPDHVLVTGSGRCGSNWLLDILDLSDATHCRSEADKLEGSKFRGLPDPVVCGVGEAELERHWNEAVAWAAQRFGERDHRIVVPKQHIRAVSQRLHLERILHGPRARRGLGLLLPALGRPEWRPSRLLVNPVEFARSTTVLKLNYVPAWADWLLRTRPEVPVIHLVRFPGGFLRSYRNRFLGRQDKAAVHAANLERLRLVGAGDAEWARRFGDIAALSVEEAELWYLRYATEVVDDAGQANAAYERVVYEQLVADTIAVARRVYNVARLPWTASIEEHLRARQSGSASIAKAWRDDVDEYDMAMIDRVFGDSPMRGWWSQGGVFSADGRTPRTGIA